MNFEKNQIVTVDLSKSASNTFLVDKDEGQTILVTHPLAEGALLRVSKLDVNTVNPNIKDSMERSIDYINNNRQFLDYNSIGDIEAIGLYFAIKRKLTHRQKQTVANMCGVLASVKLGNDIKEAILTVNKNSSILDDFNLMWFNNFADLFSGRKPIVSSKQRRAIFNIAGHVLAELENPTASRRK
jgi:hypothetical protein